MARFYRLGTHGLLLAVGIGVILFTDHLTTARLAELRKHETDLVAAQLIMSAKSSIEGKIAALDAMCSFYLYSNQTHPSDLNEFARTVFARQGSFKFMMCVDKDFVVADAFIPEATKKEMPDLVLEGIDLKQDEYAFSIAKKAVTARKAVVSKPLSIPGDGQGIFVVLPLYFGDTFVGLVIGVFDLERVLGEIIPRDLHRCYYIILADEEGNLLWGRTPRDHAESRVYDISFANSCSKWKFCMRLRAGLEGSYLYARIPIWVLGLVLVGSLNLFIHFVFQRRKYLEELVSRRTEDLRMANEDLREMAQRDPLTQLFNRRYFYERLRAELDRAREEGLPLSCLLVDLDNFKVVNDTRGHLAGDAVLVETAKILKASVRRDDIVARYGGEEFVLLLVGADKATAARIAERIRAEIQAMWNRKFADASHAVDLTASIGVTEFFKPDDVEIDTDDIINQADSALYEAKRSGKNAVVFYSG